MIAGLHVCDALADRFDDARGFVAHDDGRIDRERAVDEVEIAVAQPRVRGAHEDLLRAGQVDDQLFDLERLGDFAKYGGVHAGERTATGRACL